MENNINKNDVSQTEQFWENEIAYFENAQESLKRCYAIIGSLKDHAYQQLQTTAPLRQEVVVE